MRARELGAGTDRLRGRWAAGLLIVLVGVGALAPIAVADPAPAGLAAVTPNTPGAPSQLTLDAEGGGGGLLGGQVPSGVELALQKGFTINPSAVGGVCTNAQANANACPASSQFATGTIDVAISGLLSQTATAKVALYVAQPQQAGDPAGAAFSFSVSSPASYSGTGLGRVVTLSDPVYGTALRFDALPIPPIPPVLQITLKSLKLATIAPNGTLPAPPASKPHKKKKRHHHKRHHRKHRAKRKHHKKAAKRRAHSAAAPFLVNPTSCTGSWALRVRVFYGPTTQERDARIPCTS